MYKQPQFLSKTKLFFTQRYYLVIALLVLAAAGLIIRLVDLTVVNRTFLQGQGNARTLRSVIMPAYRGIISDRNGESLAISTPVDSIWVNPQEFSYSNQDISKLSAILHLPKQNLRSHLTEAKNRDFVYLKRDLDPDVGAVVKALGLPGIYVQREYRRFYPEGEITAHVLGFTNVDDKGQEGLELAYNDWLQGAPGLKRVLQDRLGHVVSEVGVLRPSRSGQNLTLSLDRRLQYFAYRELISGISKYKATSGSAVVLDIRTGEILAMVNGPSFNPNNRSKCDANCYRNRAVTDTFEPGSAIKSFSMASALASGKFQFHSKVKVAPGWMMVANKKISDEHHHGEFMDLTDILKYSSNVGMSKITLSLPAANLLKMLHVVGFGQLTESGFPGERAGLLPNYPNWNPFVLATLSFGYGLTVTPLQIAQAYAIFAAGGIKHPVTFLKRDNSNRVPGEQVVSPKVSKEILQMLESVLVKGGTAPLAKVSGYRVTGKTGTARIVGPHGYEKHHHNSIFVGAAPASDPRLVILVILHDPQGGQYYGGYTSGPIFSHIMGEALRLMNVPPDDKLIPGTSSASNNAIPPASLAD